MQWYPAAMRKLILPAALIAVCYSARSYIGQSGAEFQAILDNLPYILCALAVLMANQFNRARLLLAAAGVATFYWVVREYLQASLTDPLIAEVYLSASLCLPVLCLYLLLVPERGIWNLYGLLFTGIFVVLTAASAALGPWLPEMSAASLEYYTPRPAEGYVLSIGVSVLVALVTVVALVLLLLRSDDTEAALLGALGSLYLVLALLHLDSISVVMCSAASLCLVWGLLRSSHAMAYRDELTGLPGRRALNERLKSLGKTYTLAMLDVDHFKRFNDAHGHDVGDDVLRLVASRMGKVGSGGTAYRWGGEEFCVVFPRKQPEECEAALERVRTEIADYKMSIRDRTLRPMRSRDGSKRRGASRMSSSEVSVTISAGMAARSKDHADPETVIVAADKQLYRAKKAGRNRLVY